MTTDDVLIERVDRLRVDVDWARGQIEEGKSTVLPLVASADAQEKTLERLEEGMDKLQLRLDQSFSSHVCDLVVKIAEAFSVGAATVAANEKSQLAWVVGGAVAVVAIMYGVPIMLNLSGFTVGG